MVQRCAQGAETSVLSLPTERASWQLKWLWRFMQDYNQEDIVARIETIRDNFCTGSGLESRTCARDGKSVGRWKRLEFHVTPPRILRPQSSYFAASLFPFISQQASNFKHFPRPANQRLAGFQIVLIRSPPSKPWWRSIRPMPAAILVCQVKPACLTIGL